MFAELQKALSVNQKVKITVWHPQDDNIEYTYTSVIQELAGHLLLVTPPTTEDAAEILPLMALGVTVGAVIETYPNPFIFYPTIQSAPSVAEEGFWLKIPEEPRVSVIQRRKHVRIPMVIPFSFEYLVAERWIPMTARTEDVSGGGMRFTSLRLFLMGQELSVHLPMGPSQSMLHLKAKVVYSAQNRIKKQPEDIYVTSCQFLDLDDVQEMALVRECFRRELGRTQ